PCAGIVALRRALRRDGTARREGTLAARSRSPAPPAQVPVQLRDLLRRVRRAAARGEGSDLSAHVAGALRRGARRSLPRGAPARGSAGDRRHPEGHQARPARVLRARDPMTALTSATRVFSMAGSPVLLLRR